MGRADLSAERYVLYMGPTVGILELMDAMRQVSLHAGPATIPTDVDLLSRSCAMQYRLTDTGVVFFEKGTGQVVL